MISSSRPPGSGGKNHWQGPKKPLHECTLQEVIEGYHTVTANDPATFKYRYSFRFLEDIIESARRQAGDNCRFGRMTRYLTLHGAAIATSDSKLQRVSKLYVLAGQQAMFKADVIASAKSKDALPFNPDMERTVGELRAWDAITKATLETMAKRVGVYDYQLAQIYAIRSLLTASLSGLGGSGTLLGDVITEWEAWLDQRAWDLYALAAPKEERERQLSEFCAEHFPKSPLADLLDRIERDGTLDDEA
jgi:hypothetical protein